MSKFLGEIVFLTHKKTGLKISCFIEHIYEPSHKSNFVLNIEEWNPESIESITNENYRLVRGYILDFVICDNISDSEIRSELYRRLRRK